MMPGYFNFARWRELAEAGPAISAEDAERLRTFRPRLNPIALGMRIAPREWWKR